MVIICMKKRSFWRIDFVLRSLTRARQHGAFCDASRGPLCLRGDLSWSAPPTITPSTNPLALCVNSRLRINGNVKHTLEAMFMRLDQDVIAEDQKDEGPSPA